jgi:predicted phosphoribosyltransferase
MFRDRADAAAKLAERLERYRGRNPLILGLPRGGAPMARRIADALEGEANVLLVRKLRAPGNPEVAIGAVDEDGQVHVARYAAGLGADEAYLAEEVARQQAVIRERAAEYRAVRAAPEARGRIVIVVDDGVATGETMRAALACVKGRGPARLIAAVGVAPPETAAELGEIADEVVAVEQPRDLGSVGEFYRDFREVTQAEAVDALR